VIVCSYVAPTAVKSKTFVGDSVMLAAGCGVGDADGEAVGDGVADGETLG
jgi:hypothetical protein